MLAFDRLFSIDHSSSATTRRVRPRSPFRLGVAVASAERTTHMPDQHKRRCGRSSDVAIRCGAVATGVTLMCCRRRCGDPCVHGRGVGTAAGEETFTAANAALVDYHHRLPLAAMFGSGTRTHDGLAAARARGRTGGQKPKPGPRQLALARAMYDELDDRGKRRYTVAQIAEEFGVTRPTIYRHLDRVPPQAPPPAA
jgi:hypothetical protein